MGYTVVADRPLYDAFVSILFVFCSIVAGVNSHCVLSVTFSVELSLYLAVTTRPSADGLSPT